MRTRVKLPLLLASAALFTGLLPGRGLLLGKTITAPFQTLPFQKLYVFGDSLSDTGNVFNASRQVLGTGAPPSPYYQGRFSNGPVWIDYLAQKLNLNPTPIAVLGNSQPDPKSAAITTASVNFAYGGATTGTSSPINAAIPGLQTQVLVFKQLLANQAADEKALYVIWMGANDYLSGVNRSDPAAQEPDPAVPVQNIVRAIESLYQFGARHFLVANLPELGETPLAREEGATAVQALNRLSDRHNQLLSQQLDALQNNLPEADLIRLDIDRLYQQTATDRRFDLATPCYNRTTGTICDQPDRHLFWDSLHPTTAAHDQISNYALTLLDQQTAATPTAFPLSGLSAIGTLGILAGVGALWRRTQRQKQD